jgi:hypothetical protein
MKSLVIPFSLALLGLVAGCQSTAPRVPGSSDYVYPAGMTIRLLEPLTIPGGYATVRLQSGRTAAPTAVQDTEPYCVFELDTVSAAPQTVSPGRFEVTSTEKRIQDFGGTPVMPSIGLSGLYGHDGPSHIYYVTEFHLRSAEDRRVRSLSCQSDQSSIPGPAQHHLTLAEMKQAAGAYFDFDLPR